MLPQLEWQSLLGSFGLSVLATLTLLILFRLARSFFNLFEKRIRSWEGDRIRSLNLQKQELLSASDICQLITGLLKALRFLFLILMFLLYIHLVFSLFPWTRQWATQLFTYFTDAFQLVIAAIVEYLPNLVFIAIIICFAAYFIKFARLIFNGIQTERISLPGFYPEWAGPTFNLFRFLIVAFSLIVLFPYLPGAGSPAFQGVSLFFGLLLSLGSTAAVANVVAGIVITYMRAFQIGDRVQIAHTIGDVIEKTLFVTRIRTSKNMDVTIPNAMVLGNHIINFSTQAKAKGVIVHSAVTIGYDIPWRQVHELLRAAAHETSRLEKDPEPFVLQTSLDDFYVTYEINAYTRLPDEIPGIYSELHQRIQDKFNEAGLEITSPHFSALRDGNPTTIPSDYLPPDYQPPHFRIGPLDRLLNMGQGKK
jgi:small-conductance mechanosensitive channel